MSEKLHIIKLWSESADLPYRDRLAMGIEEYFAEHSRGFLKFIPVN